MLKYEQFASIGGSKLRQTKRGLYVETKHSKEIFTLYTYAHLRISK